MKILMVLYSHECGGAQRHLIDLMEGLRRQGDQPYFAGPLDSWLGRELASRGFPLFQVPLRGSALDLYSLWRLRQLIRKEKIELVHTHLGRATYYGGVAGWLCNVPVVTTIHGADYYRHLRSGREGRIIAVSAAVKGYLLLHGLPTERITVIHNGIEPLGIARPERQGVRRELGLAADDFACCAVARFHPVKRHALLIDAFVAAQLEKARLFLIGETSGECYAAIKARIAGLGLEKRVIFLGQRDDVPRLLQAMDVALLPSRWEGLGLTLLEAMSAGVPVLAAAVGGIPEIVTHGRTGYLFLEPEELTELLQRVASGRNEKLIAAAVREVETRFSLTTMVAGTRQVYAELLSEAAHA